MSTAPRIARLALPFVLALPASPVSAQQSFTIDDLAFITDHWTRTTDGMHVELALLPPAAGTLAGLQRRTRDAANWSTSVEPSEQCASWRAV